MRLSTTPHSLRSLLFAPQAQQARSKRTVRSNTPVGQLLLSLTVAFCLSIPQMSYAQQDSRNLAAVLNVINNYLLDGLLPAIDEPSGQRVDLTLGQLDSNTYRVSSDIYFVFEPQSETTELCFDLSTSDAIQQGDLVIELNGRDLSYTISKDNCVTFTVGLNAEINYLSFQFQNSGLEVELSNIELSSTNQTELTLPQVTRGGWDNAAVRKVLSVFAFGGHALDAQIQDWADMPAHDAIREMLNFNEHNPKLSPRTPCDSDTPCERYTQTESSYGTLRSFVNFISSEASDIPIPSNNRAELGLDGYRFEDSFLRMVTVRGLNPFRQRIGFWETNYHLAVNREVGVSRDQITEYYDVIMEAHEAGVPYHQVLGAAAKSAAVATQYGHSDNRWNRLSEECDCNEDFAREIHQLYYGIFGSDDPNHEDVTIPETAKMLTDMRVGQNNAPDNIVVFETEYHHIDPVFILGQNITGGDASQKIDDLMPRSILHPEALENLPVMIITGLADDNLSESRRIQLRRAWAAMGANKSFLDFIHAYATSTLFHSRSQAKYFTSFERALYKANKFNLDNLEGYFLGSRYNNGRAGFPVESIIYQDEAGEVFSPLHNVFGGQTSAEASDSSTIYERNYNLLTEQDYRFRDVISCSNCDQGSPWDKKWQAFLPRAQDGEFYVEDAAEWLWRHITGSLEHYGELERAHLLSILGATRQSPGSTSDQNRFYDFNLLMCAVRDLQLQSPQQAISIAYLMSNGRDDNYCRNDNNGSSEFTQTELDLLEKAYTETEIREDALIQQLLNELGNNTLPLLTNSGSNQGKDLREHARERVHAAIAFIFTTPYVFAEVE